MDNLTIEQRRKNMQNIKSTGTKPERLIAKELRRRKIYFSANVKSLPGKPDFVFRRKKIVVFVDSDFWHGNTNRCIMPKSNCEYWEQKISRNRQRDLEVNNMLQKNGWFIIRLWEYDIKKYFEKTFSIILRQLQLS